MPIYTVRPTADSTPLQWAVVPSGFHFAKLDNFPFQDTRLIQAITPDIADQHKYGNSPADFDAGVSIRARARVSWVFGANQGDLIADLYFGGVFQGQFGSLNMTGTQPVTGFTLGTITLPFTKAQADDIEVRYRGVNDTGWVLGTGTVNVTEAFVDPTYVVAPSRRIRGRSGVAAELAGGSTIEEPRGRSSIAEEIMGSSIVETIEGRCRVAEPMGRSGITGTIRGRSKVTLEE